MGFRNMFASKLLCILIGGISALVLDRYIHHLLGYKLTRPPTIKEVKKRDMVIVNDKPKVYTYNGTSFHHLVDFCTLTPQFECTLLDSAHGPLPIYLHDDFQYSMSASIKKDKRWEPQIWKVILSELEKYPEAGLLDLGSNIGPFSLLAAKHGRKVVSVDAVIHSIQRLCKSVDKNGFSDNVTMVLNALSDKHGNVTLNINSDTPDITKVVETAGKPSECGDVDRITTVMLDDLIPLVSFTTAILKIDVESFEYHVINGGKSFLQEIDVPSIVMEWKHVKEKPEGKLLAGLLNSMKFIPHLIQNDGKHKVLKNSEYKKWPHDVLWRKK